MNKIIGALTMTFIIYLVIYLSGWFISQDHLWYYTSIGGRIIAIITVLYILRFTINFLIK